MLPVTAPRSRKEEIKCIMQGKYLRMQGKKPHFQAKKFPFKCSNQWQVLRDIKTISLLQSYEEKRELKGGMAVMRQCLSQERDNLLFVRIFY